jgi:hypothetical protein
VPRKTRGSPEELQEDISYSMRLRLDREMVAFLEVESKRLSEQQGRRIRPTDIARALITSYYEKRIAGLVTCPDD